MSTKEINDLISVIADAAFSIGNNIIIDRASLEYQLCLVKDKEVRDHAIDVINSLLLSI